MTDQTTSCWIYRSNKKDQMYLYISQQNQFDDIPEVLLQGFGKPHFVMQLELSPNKQLARANSKAVISALNENGYYLQMPPKLDPEMYYGD